MKKSSFFLPVILITLIAVSGIQNAEAQSPPYMSYQAVIRDTFGVLLPKNTVVGMQISILQQSPTGTPVYVETHSTTTNENGLVNIKIGAGTVVTGNFSTISWAANIPYFSKIETDPAGGTNYTITGTSQLISVPYAFYADTAKYAITGSTGFSNWQVFDSSGNFHVPPGVTKLLVELWGGGGGGGAGGGGDNNGATWSGEGGGGGGAAYAKELLNATAGNDITVTVGAGGTAGVENTVNAGPNQPGPPGGNGGDGGNSSFGGSAYAFGGYGGSGGSGGPTPTGAGIPGGGGDGANGGGTLGIGGQFGNAGLSWNGSGWDGRGGSAGGGGSFGARVVSGTFTGNLVPGGGGSGGMGSNGTGSPGIAGGHGRVIVWW